MNKDKKNNKNKNLDKSKDIQTIVPERTEEGGLLFALKALKMVGNNKN